MIFSPSFGTTAHCYMLYEYVVRAFPGNVGLCVLLAFTREFRHCGLRFQISSSNRSSDMRYTSDEFQFKSSSEMNWTFLGHECVIVLTSSVHCVRIDRVLLYYRRKTYLVLGPEPGKTCTGFNTII